MSAAPATASTAAPAQSAAPTKSIAPEPAPAPTASAAPSQAGTAAPSQTLPKLTLTSAAAQFGAPLAWDAHFVAPFAVDTFANVPTYGWDASLAAIPLADPNFGAHFPAQALGWDANFLATASPAFGPQFFF